MCEISVVIPVRDEEKNIRILIDRISATLQSITKTFEIIFITDINRDNTVDVLEQYSKEFHWIKTLKLANSFGQHVAVMAGLDHSAGSAIVIMDGDLQDYPEDIPLLYAKLQEGYDIVYAVKESKNDSLFRNLSSRLFNSLMNRLSDVQIDSNSSMFRIITKRALREVIRFREYEPSLTYIFSYINLPATKILVRSGARQEGITKYNLLRLISFAVSSLLSFSRKPLRIISTLGIIMSLFSFFYFGVVLFQYFFQEIAILGWATMIVLITFMGGIQLLSLGIIGEYIGRIYMQTKSRPLYIIEQKIGHFESQ